MINTLTRTVSSNSTTQRDVTRVNPPPVLRRAPGSKRRGTDGIDWQGPAGRLSTRGQRPRDSCEPGPAGPGADERA